MAPPCGVAAKVGPQSDTKASGPATGLCAAFGAPPLCAAFGAPPEVGGPGGFTGAALVVSDYSHAFF